jgi:hypothetical protein
MTKISYKIFTENSNIAHILINDKLIVTVFNTKL